MPGTSRVAATVLYRYVRSKSDLVILMTDEAVRPPASTEAAAGWRERTQATTRALFDSLMAHPWVLDAPVHPLPMTPNALRWGELLLRGLPAGLRPEDRMRMVTVLTGYAREQARLATSIAGQSPDADDDQHTASKYVATLLGLVDAADFPEFSTLLTSSAFAGPVGYTPADFTFGLDRIIAGLNELVDST